MEMKVGKEKTVKRKVSREFKRILIEGLLQEISSQMKECMQS